MMRSIFITLSMILACTSVEAQSTRDSSSSFSIPFFQFGVNIADVAVPALTTELVFRAHSNQQVGLRLSFPSYFSYDEYQLYQGTNWAVKGYLFHKYLISYSDIEAITIKNGLRLGISDLYYDTEAWVASNRFGNTVYTYEKVIGSDQNVSLGYELQVGWLTRSRWFYTEFAIGFYYESYINTQSMSVLEYKDPQNMDLDYYSPGYEYEGTFRPTLNILVGLNFD